MDTARACLRIRLPSRCSRLALIAALLATGVTASCARTIHQRNAVHVLTADAEVNPVLERYIDRGVDEAERTGPKAVVISVVNRAG